MKIIKFVLLSISLTLVHACAIDIEEENHELSSAQITISNYIKDLENKKSFNFILKKYFYNFDEIIESDNYVFFEGMNDQMSFEIINNIDSLNFIWNEDILEEAKMLDWALDKSSCHENLIILLKDYPQKIHYIAFCFTENGKIYSALPLLDSESNSIEWIR